MKTYDIVICGAGSAGFCAAVAAARQGAKTALIEKYNTPGGILTVLGNNSIDQFNNPFINDDKMIIKGIGWEFVKRLHKDGFANIPDMDAEYQCHNQYGVKVNPIAAAKIMDDMLIESGVDLYYGQPMVDASSTDNEIESVTISTKAGLRKVKAKIFIDCSGDGDLAEFAGAEFVKGDGEGTFQPGTLRFYPSVYVDSPIIGYGDNRNHIKLDTTDSDNITKAEIYARNLIYEQMKSGQRIMATAPAVAPREGRRIAGITQLSVKDYCEGTVFDDSVCYTYWFIDIHKDNEPTYIQYIKHDKTPTIRLSAMISKDFSNFMMAGRCISSDRETNSAIRVKASCMAMGEACGTAAAIAVKSNVHVADIDIIQLKNTLTNNGAIVPGVGRTLAYNDVIN
ncbi:MAG: FAD-dependent oxidoreductase [Eubacteriales bacterium]|nr:FAD-dependent oxidoreductase [Eubacteriales bacterium]